MSAASRQGASNSTIPLKPSSGIKPGVPGAPSSVSGRKPVVKNIATDRAALGLSAMKPSEMIAGLDKVAERAEKIEAREEAKRRAGGKLNANEALLNDDTGKKMSHMVYASIFIVIAGIAALGIFLFYMANREIKDPRKLRAQTQETLTKLVALASRIKPFEEGDSITSDKVKSAFIQIVDGDLKIINEEIAKDKVRRANGDKFRTPDRIMSADFAAISRLHKMQDGWGKPLEFSMADADTIKVTAAPIKEPGIEPLEPVTIRVRSGKPAQPEKATPPEKASK